MIVPNHTLRRVSLADAPAIQALFAQDPEYWVRVEGAPLRDEEAAITIAEVPPGFPIDKKHVFVVDDIALLDMLEGYPDAHTWFLGLIFLAPASRRRGFGTMLVEAICDYARSHGARALRLAVADTNPEARGLYDRLGFEFVIRKQRTVYSGAIVELDVMQRAL